MCVCGCGWVREREWDSKNVNMCERNKVKDSVNIYERERVKDPNNVLECAHERNSQ